MVIASLDHLTAQRDGSISPTMSCRFESTGHADRDISGNRKSYFSNGMGTRPSTYLQDPESVHPALHQHKSAL